MISHKTSASTYAISLLGIVVIGVSLFFSITASRQNVLPPSESIPNRDQFIRSQMDAYFKEKNLSIDGENNVISSAAHKTFTVAMSTDGLHPDYLQIPEGGTVRFLNTDQQPRWPASDPHPTHEILNGFDPRRGLFPGDSFEFTFSQPGEWRYHDHLSPHRKGTILVQPRQTQAQEKEIFFLKSVSASASRLFQKLADFWPIAKPQEYPADGIPPEIAQLLATHDKIAQAKIVRAMAQKYGPLRALDYMVKSGLPFTGESHLLVHEIGNVAYERYGQKALLYCNESFLSACYHGVILNELGDHGFQGVARTIERCKEAGNQIFTQCAHAAGHGFLAWKNYNVLTALPLCDKLGELNRSIPLFNCYDGVFMENIFGVHEGKPSANRMVKADDPFYPCNAVPEKYRGGCWADQATLMFQLFNGDLRKVASACDKVADKKYKAICYNNFARQLHTLTEGKVAKAITLCDTATGEWKDQCLLTLVSSAFSVGDREQMPYQICAFMSAQGSPQHNACYEQLFGLIGSYSKTADTAHDFCVFVQESARRNECLKKFGLPAETNKTIPFSEKNEGGGDLAPNYREIQELIEKNGVKTTYQYIIQEWSANPVAAHDIAHMVGRSAYKELGAAGFSVCDSNFAFGCYHGLLEEMLRDKGSSAIKIAQDACNNLSPQGQIVSCLHGIGHGILVWKNMDLKSALEVCDSFATAEKLYCFDGSFMEFYSGAMEQGKKIEVSSENLWKFCMELLPQFQTQCVRNHTFFLIRPGTGQSADILPPCGDLSSALKPDCIRSVGFFASQSARGSLDASKKTCRGFKNQDDYSLCILSASQEFIFEGLPETAVRPLCQGLNDTWEKNCAAGIVEMITLYGRK